MSENNDRLTLGERLAHALLLFYQPGPWTKARADEWRALMGETAVTTKVLGDLARRVLAQRQR